MGNLKKLGNFALWFLGVMGVLGAVASLAEEPAAFVPLLIGGALLLPPLRARLPSALGRRTGIVLAILAYSIGGILLSHHEMEEAARLGFASVEEYREEKRKVALGQAPRLESPSKPVNKPTTTSPLEESPMTPPTNDMPAKTLETQNISALNEQAVPNANSSAHIKRIQVTDQMPPFKRSVEVYLTERVSEEELRRISQSIKNDAGDAYQRIFVGFWLPESNPATGPYWATAHHNPNLEVHILGSTREQYAAARAGTDKTKRKGEEVVAQALFDGPGGAQRIVIVVRGGKYFARNYFGDDAEGGEDEPLIKKGNRYWKLDNDFGENYRVTADRLEIFDKDGLVDTAERE